MPDQPIHAVIFDLGGVILDWNPRYVYQKYFNTHEEIERFLAEIDFPNWNLQQDKGRPFAEGVAALSERYPHYAPLIRAYHEHWEDSVVGPIEGSVEIARALKSGGYPLYALSNWSAETFPIAQERYECLKLFDAILISGDARIAKPDAKIFELMLHRVARPAGECLFIDDSSSNVAVAARLGFSTILFESPDQLAEALTAMRLLEGNWRDS